MNSDTISVAAFYKFCDFHDFEQKREPLLKFCVAKGLKGTILLAPEGINGTVGGTRKDLDSLLSLLREDPRLADLEAKYSLAEAPINARMKIKLKDEIVSFEMPDFDPQQGTGTYVDPENWNALIQDPDVILIDTRNEYEVEMGTFQNAIDPKTNSFKDLEQFTKANLNPETQQKVAMFCTGGIRCEKATAWMKEQGFQEVYHLKGGILNYLERISHEQSLWQGECFVFDDRVSVTHDLEPGTYELCRACRKPVSDADKQRPEFEYGVSCHRCIDQTDEAQKNNFRERIRQIKLAERRGDHHLGPTKPIQAAERV